MTGLQRLYDYAERERILIHSARIPFSPAVTIRDRDELEGEFFYIALDPRQLCGECEEKHAVLHELSHIAVGAFYRNEHDIFYRRKMENKALRWQILHEIPREALEEALADGCTSPWELAERFEVTQDFMEKALFFYRNGYIA